MPMNWTDLTDKALLLSIAMAMHRSAQQFRPLADWADLDPEIQQAALHAVTDGLTTPEGIEFARRLVAATEEDVATDAEVKAHNDRIAHYDRMIEVVFRFMACGSGGEQFAEYARAVRDLEEAKAIAAGNRGV